jgi:hypothetical protein
MTAPDDRLVVPRSRAVLQCEALVQCTAPRVRVSRRRRP